MIEPTLLSLQNRQNMEELDSLYMLIKYESSKQSS